MPTPKMTAEDKRYEAERKKRELQWQTESDASTLRRLAELQGDKARMTRAANFLQKEATATANAVKIAKGKK